LVLEGTLAGTVAAVSRFGAFDRPTSQVARAEPFVEQRLGLVHGCGDAERHAVVLRRHAGG